MDKTIWNYSGKHAVVTGASSGIGLATALELLSLGAKVTALDLKHPPQVLTGRVRYVSLNLADEHSIDAAAAEIDEPVDAVFNCAGISDGAGDALTVMTVNFLGLRAFTEGVLPTVVDGGAVANVASLSAHAYRDNIVPIADFLTTASFGDSVAWLEAHPAHIAAGGYTFSKQCVIMFTKKLSATVTFDRRIRFNCISPGPVDTPLLDDTKKIAAHREFLQRLPKPLGRIATADDQARVLVFLNSEAASFVNGQNVLTDGGYAAGVEVGELELLL